MSNLVVSFVAKFINQTVAPLKQLAGDMAKVGQKAGNAAKPVADAGKAINGLADPAKKAGDALDGVVAPADKAGSGVKDAGDKAEAAGKKFGGLGNVLHKTVLGLLWIDGVILTHKALIGSAITGLVLWTKGQTDATLANANAAKAAGVSFQSYQRLGYAVTSANLPITVLDSAFKSLADHVLQARLGSKSAVSMFQAMKVSLKDTNGHAKTADVLFADLADKFAAMPPGMKKAALANKLFGSAGSALIPILDGGAKGLQALGDHAQKMNLIIGDDTVKNAQLFSDAWQGMTDRLFGFKNSVYSGVLPPLTRLIDKISEIIDQNKADILKGITDGLNWLTQHLPSILKGMSDFVGLMKDIIKFAAGVVQAIGGMNTVLKLCGVILAANIAVAAVGAISAIVGFAGAVWAAVPAVWAFTIALLANPITWVVLAVVALIAVIVLAVIHWKTIAKWFGILWDGIKKGFGAAVDYVTEGWRQLATFFTGIWDSIKSAFSAGINAIWNILPEWFRNILKGIAFVVKIGADGVKDLASAVNSGGPGGGGALPAAGASGGSQVDVHLHAPAGTTVKSVKGSPGTNTSVNRQFDPGTIDYGD